MQDQLRAIPLNAVQRQAVMMNHPPLVDQYLQKLECRAEVAKARFRGVCAIINSVGNPGVTEEATKQLRQRNDRLLDALGLEVEAYNHLSVERIASIPSLDQTRDFHGQCSALEASLGAVEDAAFAVEDLAAVAGTMPSAAELASWRCEIEKRMNRYESLRRTLYRERVLRGARLPNECG